VATADQDPRIALPSPTSSGDGQDLAASKVPREERSSWSFARTARISSDGLTIARTERPRPGPGGLVGSSIVLTGREWEGYASVYPVDGQTPSGFLLFGGVKDCSDPDLYMVLRWSPIEPSDKR
jgi:hypothetical protein